MVGDDLGYAEFDSKDGSINIFNLAYNDGNGNSYIQASLIHETEHWANSGKDSLSGSFVGWGINQNWYNRSLVYSTI